ncbi:long-chain-fatty-acid--CoA ligase [Brevibacillus sp. SYSU BS000544]|uniref:long-chain-fatty-acid--CoA ligase n=1 Tax=Brevibacillus sp. SYSU BS000544 TaxID=3416443 RepID=UPI003CE4B969
MVITQGLITHAKGRPNKVAILDGEKSFTYREFADRVCKLAGSLEQAGVQKGDRVALLMLNESRYLELLYGITLLGAVAVPLNVRLAPAEVSFILQDSGAKYLFMHREFLPLLPKLKAEVDSVLGYILCEDNDLAEGTKGYEDFILEGAPVELQARAEENDVAGIFYTGGTTGLPKGVMLTHRNLLSNAYNVGLALGYNVNDVYLHAAPMFHLADGASTFAITVVGGTHAHVRFFEPNLVLKTIQDQKVTSSLLVPTMITMLINTPSIKEYNLSSWKKVLYGASPCPPEVLKKAKSLLPIDFFQGYGLSEASPVLTFLFPQDHVVEGDERLVNRLASCGQPLPGVEVRCVNGLGEDVQPGEVGEIIAKGPTIMKGYWNRPEETFAAIKNGWLYTGDMATVDDENFFFIVDRKKDMIVTGGENVYSVEVENSIYTHPAVLEAAVVGVPDEKWGEAVKAVVVLRKDAELTEEALINHCRTQLANYKVPKSVEFVNELPKSGAGKILKRNLRDQYWQGLQRKVN